MTPADVNRDLYVPDRYEGLREADSRAMRTIISPVEEALEVIDRRFQDMRAARRGSLMILRGESGAGKSTFLDTVGLFRQGVVTKSVSTNEDVVAALQRVGPSSTPRILVLDGREALRDVSASAIEAALHAINSFVRSVYGQTTLVVWPTNTDDLTDMLVSFAKALGGNALIDIDDPVLRFSGPAAYDFVSIGERTVAALNEGASFGALGISDERAAALAKDAKTIGNYLALVRGDLLRNDAKVRKLLKAEQLRLWTLVIATNEPEGDVAALTRGGFAYVDIDRLMTATGANIVANLKKNADRLGILGTVLDARIIFMDIMTALAVCRRYGDPKLHALMKARKISTSADNKAAVRLRASELGVLIAANSLGTRKVGGKPGRDSQTSFKGLAEIARSNDGLLNTAIGNGLVKLGLASEFKAEQPLGTALKFNSDLCIELPDSGRIRLEVMWRSKVGRADIANYALTKLGNYAKAIGLLND